jgi:thiosulfate dehydrogenase [quinone] large subunit
MADIIDRPRTAKSVRRTAPPAGASPIRASQALALTRLGLGWLFLWAFLDKTFGLGFATERADAWVNGGSPTYGYLTFGSSGPFASAFQSIAGAGWADWLFMLGLLGLGVALLLGIGLRVAAVTGSVLVLLMWLAALPPETNPFLTYHVLYALLLWAYAFSDNGTVLGAGAGWQRTRLVQSNPWLR